MEPDSRGQRGWRVGAASHPDIARQSIGISGTRHKPGSCAQRRPSAPRANGDEIGSPPVEAVDAVHALNRLIGSQFLLKRDSRPFAGDLQVGRDLGERLQHETALVQAGLSSRTAQPSVSRAGTARPLHPDRRCWPHGWPPPHRRRERAGTRSVGRGSRQIRRAAANRRR